MANGEQPAFSKWRSLLWPVHGYELKKLLPILFIFFIISFNYNILRTTKDTLIVTAPKGGSEVIPFIKVWVMLPMALLLTYIFTRISESLSRENTFYAMISIFMTYFLFFAIFLYPNRTHLHPHEFCDWLEIILPQGASGFIAMLRYWVFTSFYVMSELWGTAIMMVAFWGFANEITHVSEAKRFYGLFGIGANLSGIASGQVAILLSNHHYSKWLGYGQTDWDQTLLLIILTISVASIAGLAAFRWLNKKVLNDPVFASVHEAHKEPAPKKQKKKSSFKKDMLYLLQSPYMLSIAIIVLSFGFVINTTEVLWKKQVSLLHPSSQAYNIYMNKVTMLTGAIATLTAIFFTGNLIRKAGWTPSALATPLILLFTSLAFFGLLIFPEFFAPLAQLGGVNIIAMTTFFGTLQNCMSRSAKYTFFDATKELAYVPLDRSTKLKGKAAIDGVVSRLGKSGASGLYNVLLISCGSLAACTPIVAVCLIGSIFLWIAAVRRVGVQFNALTEEKEQLQEGVALSKETVKN